MRKLYADLVQETTATTGTGTVTLAQMAGWVRFSDRFSVADRVYYSIRDGSNWEVGFGTVGSSNTLARTQILGTLTAGTWASNPGAALTLAAGTKVVRATAPEALLQTFMRADLNLVSINTALEDGKSYGVQAPALTLTLPASPIANDRIEIFQAATAITGTIVDPGAKKINATTGAMTIDIDNFAFWLTYVSDAYGWKVQ